MGNDVGVKARRDPVLVVVAVLAVFYFGCALYNLLFTLQRAETAYWPHGFGESAWFPPYQWILEHLVQPNALLFTIGMIVLQVLIGSHLLARGQKVEDGLMVGTVFLVLLVPALGWIPALVTLAIAAVQLWAWVRLRDRRLGSLGVLARRFGVVRG
jgi:hypothetical protein